MTRLKFAAFLPPHHAPREHPTLLIQRDLELVSHLDALGYDEFWCGEHHSTGWEVISSPEVFLSAAAMRTNRIGLGTGVVSLPYHNPFHVANRIVLLDHISRGRALLGSGPGAVPIDQEMLGLDQMALRAEHGAALGAVIDLLRGKRVTQRGRFYDLHDARLQLLPLQEELPIVVASSQSPSGMKIAGQYGAGVLSVASNSPAGASVLPTQWAFAEESAKEHGQLVDRANWRVQLAWHIAETREQAEREVANGLLHWNNEYSTRMLQRPDESLYDTPQELLAALKEGKQVRTGTLVIGTPDDLVNAIGKLQEITGGFGVVTGFAHDWASREDTLRSWEMVARYVIPEVNGLLDPLRASAEHVRDRMPVLMQGMQQAIQSAIKAG